MRVEIIITGADHAGRLEVKADLMDLMGVSASRTVQTKEELEEWVARGQSS